MADQLCVQYYINAGSYVGSRFDISIFGDKGEILFSLDEKILIYRRSNIGQKEVVNVNGVYEDEQENKVSIFSGSFRYFAPLVIKAIETGDTSLISTSASFEDALYNLKVLDAIKLSANKGEAVVLGKETNTYV